MSSSTTSPTASSSSAPPTTATTSVVPSLELDHLDRMAEAHARTNRDQVVRVNQQIVDLLPPMDSNGGAKRILDYGCGAGHTAILLAQQQQHSSLLNNNTVVVVGVDISPGMISQAQENLQRALETTPDLKDRIEFRLLTSRSPTRDELLRNSTNTQDDDSGSKEEEGMDLAIMSLVLGHISPREAGAKVVETVVSTLKQGGKFALAEFVYTAGEEEEQDKKEVSDKYSHNHNHDHGHHHDHSHSHHGGHVAFTETELRQLFQHCGLQPEPTFTPFEFDWGEQNMKCVMAIGTKL